LRLSWLMRLRIAAACGVGVALVAAAAWPLVAPGCSLEVLSLAGGMVKPVAVMALAGLAFAAGLIAYFVSWPYGLDVGVLAVPVGLAVWALLTGSLASLVGSNAGLEQRMALFAGLKWEGFAWLGVVLAGFAGVRVGAVIAAPKPTQRSRWAETGSGGYLTAAAAVVGSVVVAWLVIGLTACDVSFYDRQMGAVFGQPAAAQIGFSVLVAFAAAGFVCKSVLGAGPAWPTVAGPVVTALAAMSYVKPDRIARLASYWPAVFYPNRVASILPIQMVSFAAIGAICGYWLAVRYRHWRKGG